jgi:hypothetical protein
MFFRGVDSTADRTGARNNNHAGLPFGCAEKRDVRVGDQLERLNAKLFKRFPHPLAYLRPSHSGKSDLGRRQFAALDAGSLACLMRRVLDRSESVLETDSKRIRRTGNSFAKHPKLSVCHNCTGLGASAVNAKQ